MSSDHPYHCLPHLITLSNGQIGSNNDTASGKVGAALTIIRELKKQDPSFLGELIESYKTVAEAYIQLAMAPVKEIFKRTEKIYLESVCKEGTVRLDRCLGSGTRRLRYCPCVLTKPPLLRPGCDYGNGEEAPVGSELIKTFESQFEITKGGINWPKVIVCIGSNGGRFKQLVKGDDDIRQDAVMEQVFLYVNGLMARQRGSNVDASHGTGQNFAKNDLSLVTYNILPLSPQAGVRNMF
jgi:ataxia telangiectasia mutated family protein